MGNDRERAIPPVTRIMMHKAGLNPDGMLPHPPSRKGACTLSGREIPKIALRAGQRNTAGQQRQNGERAATPAWQSATVPYPRLRASKALWIVSNCSMVL